MLQSAIRFGSHAIFRTTRVRSEVRIIPSGGPLSITPATTKDQELISHLLRRAGFGATYDELEKYTAKGYEATVEELLRGDEQPALEEDLMMRLNAHWTQMAAPWGGQTYWVFRMINSKRPLEEKISLFWHGVLCTGNAKVDWPRQMITTINKFRQLGLGNFRDILVELGQDPAMVYFLDNCMSHNGAINENWGRELLELFSMGVGNYTEDDVKQAARAFTGWTNASTTPVYPNGRVDWQFMYDPTDHDAGEKTFLGERGKFNGEDVVDIICRQPATAGFIARYMYSFFVADDVPVPQGPIPLPRTRKPSTSWSGPTSTLTTISAPCSECFLTPSSSRMPNLPR